MHFHTIGLIHFLIRHPLSQILRMPDQLDADMKEKISAICYMHDAQISKNEIIMMIDDDELYTKLNEYGKMLLEIENLFTQGSAYSQ